MGKLTYGDDHYPFLSKLLEEGEVKIGDFLVLKDAWSSDCLAGNVMGVGQNSIILKCIDGFCSPIFAEDYWVLDVNPVLKKDSEEEVVVKPPNKDIEPPEFDVVSEGY